MKPTPLYRQFVLGPVPVHEAAGWQSKDWGAGLHLSWDPALSVAEASAPKRRLILLGDILDPENPAHANDAIARDILKTGVSFDAVVETLGRMGGRYVVIVQLEDLTRVYTDAFASRSVFYTRDRNGACWASGSPGPLAHLLNLPRDDERMERLFAQSHDTQMPGAVTPYRDIHLLWCHHYLDPYTADIVRYYPRHPLPHLSLDEAATRMRNAMHGLLAAAIQRRPVVVGLAGGFDSRVMLAALRPLVNEVEFVTWTAPGIATWDVELACQLGRRLRLNHRVVEVVAPDPDVLEAFDVCCGGAVWGTSRTNLTTLIRAYGNDRFVVCGNGGETGRCYLYKDGRHPSVLLDAVAVCAHTEFAGNAVAEEAYAEWMATLEDLQGFPLLDLCHWELHTGVWLGWTFMPQEWGGHPLMAFNSRMLIETMLSVEPALRAFPHILFQRVVELYWPEALRERINHVPPRTWGASRMFWDRARRGIEGITGLRRGKQ